WIDFFRGHLYHGGKVSNFHRPLDEIPVFAKAGAIVPLNSLGKADNKLGGRENMEILVFPGRDNSFTFYEDDGDTYAYEKGAVSTTDLRITYTDKKAVFEIDEAKGDYKSVSKRRYKVSFRGYSKKARVSVEIDGKPVAVRREYDENTNTLTLLLPKCATSKKIKITLTAKNLLSEMSDIDGRIFDILLRSRLEHKEKEDIWEAYETRKDDACFAKYLVDRTTSKSLAESILELITI
ncbi:MAG: DUF5110 domain-containing protein, partial [Clostridia bacterium]|nr:DUF5110 domain-containing protein [Clostridia bacterium]